MGDPTHKFTFSLTHCYLEMARAAAGPLSFHHPIGDLRQLVETYGHNPIASAILAVVSVVIVYSYLAIESFMNYQLYRVWETRAEATVESERFLRLLGDSAPFERYRNHSRVRDLGERIKVLCEIKGYRKPHEAIPRQWQQFKELAEASRHFLVHPTPDPVHFQRVMKRVLHELPTGRYPDLAVAMIGFFYDESRTEKPEWLSRNTLIRFRGIDVLPTDDGASPGTQQASKDALGPGEGSADSAVAPSEPQL